MPIRFSDEPRRQCDDDIRPSLPCPVRPMTVYEMLERELDWGRPFTFSRPEARDMTLYDPVLPFWKLRLIDWHQKEVSDGIRKTDPAAREAHNAKCREKHRLNMQDPEFRERMREDSRRRYLERKNRKKTREVVPR